LPAASFFKGHLPEVEDGEASIGVLSGEVLSLDMGECSMCPLRDDSHGVEAFRGMLWAVLQNFWNTDVGQTLIIMDQADRHMDEFDGLYVDLYLDPNADFSWHPNAESLAGNNRWNVFFNTYAP